MRRVLATKQNRFLICRVECWILWGYWRIEIFYKSELVLLNVVYSNNWALYMRFCLSKTLNEVKFIICFLHLRLLLFIIFFFLFLSFLIFGLFLLILLFFLTPKSFEFGLCIFCYEDNQVLRGRKLNLSIKFVITNIFDVLIQFFPS